jgi:thiamine kinase
MIEEALLARVPGCEGGSPPLQIEPLTGGRGCNAVVRIDTRAGRFVLRSRHSPQDRPGSVSRTELLSHQLAAAAGLAPRLIDADDDGAWLLMEFVAAETWTESRLFAAAGIDALGAQLQRLHAIPLPVDLPPIDAPAIARGYLRMIAAHDAALAGSLVQELRAVEADSRELDSMADRATLNHGDLQAANLLGPGPVLVDWEYAQRCHPTYDLACLLAYYPALQARQEHVLAACGLDSPGDRRILSHQQRLFTRLNRLWQLAHTETG